MPLQRRKTHTREKKQSNREIESTAKRDKKEEVKCNEKRKYFIKPWQFRRSPQFSYIAIFPLRFSVYGILFDDGLSSLRNVFIVNIAATAYCWAWLERFSFRQRSHHCKLASRSKCKHIVNAITATAVAATRAILVRSQAYLFKLPHTISA